MEKKMTRIDHEFLIDGKPVSLLEIAESTGDSKVWRSFLDRHQLQHDPSADRYLKGKLGEYLSAYEIHTLSGIRIRTLNKWRVKGILQAEHLNSRWYYSVRDLINAIKSADIRDIRS
jgi:hypothetical protein